MGKTKKKAPGARSTLPYADWRTVPLDLLTGDPAVPMAFSSGTEALAFAVEASLRGEAAQLSVAPRGTRPRELLMQLKAQGEQLNAEIEMRVLDRLTNGWAERASEEMRHTLAALVYWTSKRPQLAQLPDVRLRWVKGGEVREQVFATLWEGALCLIETVTHSGEPFPGTLTMLTADDFTAVQASQALTDRFRREQGHLGMAFLWDEALQLACLPELRSLILGLDSEAGQQQVEPWTAWG